MSWGSLGSPGHPPVAHGWHDLSGSAPHFPRPPRIQIPFQEDQAITSPKVFNGFLYEHRLRNRTLRAMSRLITEAAVRALRPGCGLFEQLFVIDNGPPSPQDRFPAGQRSKSSPWGPTSGSSPGRKRGGSAAGRNTSTSRRSLPSGSSSSSTSMCPGFAERWITQSCPPPCPPGISPAIPTARCTA
jgi:hypothetical protein